jgi:hypothetical protein
VVAYKDNIKERRLDSGVSLDSIYDLHSLYFLVLFLSEGLGIIARANIKSNLTIPPSSTRYHLHQTSVALYSTLPN